ncbi:glycoside hydrolase family 38 C-terminal domain-containing protein [Chitinophaga caseinilytica]|uniref:glycoside hydrolase family 38 N-terminal domain-containing protein n=1 Tax=Chitinophaga caseinilytica TaxID=2267521 RepID=UPI003C2F8DFF
MKKLHACMSLTAAMALFCGNVSAQERVYSIVQQVRSNEIRLNASGTFGADQNVGHLTDGSGLQDSLHDNNGSASTMWHTALQPAATSPAAGVPAFPAWVRFDFSSPKAFSSLLIWNHNQERLTNRGFRATKVYGTTDGQHWQLLKGIELPEARSLNGKASKIDIHAASPLKAVIIAAESNWGGNVFGLSEVKFESEKKLNEAELPFPQDFNCTSTSIYRYCKDGKPGREVTLDFSGNSLYAASEIEAVVDGRKETASLPFNKYGYESAKLVLPSGVGVNKKIQVFVQLKAGKRVMRKSFILPKQRQWTVYIYPHSHVDIGYTNTHENVEIIHKRNLVNAIQLAKQTANYPDGARYLWNPEVIWPVERYLKDASADEKADLFDAIRKGYIHLDAGYINDNTSVTADEEFPGFFGEAKRMEKITGIPVRTIVQVDVPGMTWGIVPMAAQFGIKYVFAPFNGSDRTGLADKVNFKPFWWIGQDGVSKVLFLQPGDYTPGARAKGYMFWPLMAGQKDPSKLIQIVKTDRPRDHFIDGYLWPKLKELEQDADYPYDLFPMTWAMADNTPIDADLPDAVKSWNEEYAYPRLVISSSTGIMSAFEKKYGDVIPTYRGDFTEYWTDGLGSAAKETGMNRNAKERLIQADVLWSMLRRGEKAPRAAMDEAWRNVLMGSEHTWCYMNPNQEDMQNAIWKGKQAFFRNAEEGSIRQLAQSLQPVAAESSETVAVFNTLAWPRSGLVTLSGSQSKGILSVWDEQGRAVSAQRLSTGELVFMASGIPAYGAKNYQLSTRAAAGPKMKMAKGNVLDNGVHRIVLDPATGDIVSIKDKKGEEFVNDTDASKVNSFRYLLGSGKQVASGPQYAANADGAVQSGPNVSAKGTGPSNVRLSIKENGPLVASILVESQADGCNALTREVRVVAGQAEIEIENWVDKVATTRKEGIHFGFAFNVPDGRTRMDIPFGVVEMEVDQLPAANRNWMGLQRWLDISNGEKGVTWASLDAPIFESGSMTANIIGGAFHSPEWIARLPLSSTVYSWALNNHWHTNFPLFQEGKVRFRYRMLPHLHAYDAVKANRFGLEQAQPLVVAPVRENVKIGKLVGVDNEKVFISIVKTAADGKSMIIRLRSVSPAPEKVRLHFPSFKPASIRTCIADETPGEETGTDIHMLPYGLTTLIVE